jgi:predicted PurR-regulated permease PerM
MKTDWNPTFRYMVGVLAFASFVAFLIYARQAVRILVVAAFIAYLINPAVTFLIEKARMSRALAVNLVYFSALILLVGIPVTMTPIFFDEAQLVIRNLLDLTSQLSAALMQPIEFAGYEFYFEQLGQSLAQLQTSVLTPLPEGLLRLVESTSVGALWALVILVSVHLLLSHWPKMRDWTFGLVPPAYQDELRELYRRIRQVWMAYLRGQIVLMVIVGVVFTIAWTIIGIPGALALGVIAGFFTLVPDVGPFLAAALAVGVALLEGSSWIPLSNIWVAGIVTITYLILINMKGLLLRPYVMGRSVHMNEGVVFVAILTATILEGIMGALLVVPLLATVALIAEYIRRRALGLPAFDESGKIRFITSLKEDKPAKSAGKRRTSKGEKKS